MTAEWADDDDEDNRGDTQLAWAVNLSLAGALLLFAVSESVTRSTGQGSGSRTAHLRHVNVC